MGRKLRNLGSYIFYSLISALVFLFVYSIFFNPSIIEENYNNIKEAISLNNKNIAVQESDLMKMCNAKVNDCINIAEKKYGSNVEILELKEFSDKESAEQFFNTWKEYSSLGYSYYGNGIEKYPVVLISTRFDNSDGSKRPWIFICNNDGVLGSQTSSFC